MKNKLPLFIVLFALSFSASGQNTKLMSYNIKYDNTNDTVNNWHDRKENLVRLIHHYKPAFIGTQEVLHRQLNYIDSCLTNYAYIGVGRDDGKQEGEYSPIHYDTTRYRVLKKNTFWLSETPSKVSIGWDASLERICTYGLFEDIQTKDRLWVFNTHFDHIGVKAREESARLIIDKIKDSNTENLPIVLMGDFNRTPDQKPIRHIKAYLKDGQEITENLFYGPRGTYSGFDQKMILNRRIDYIFTKDLKVKRYMHIDDRMENNKHISDHLPILITIEHYKKS
ncbi:MAG: endonuclease/exonuclease/phosphatase family protein [Flavobacteriaceae bacterium]